MIRRLQDMRNWPWTRRAENVAFGVCTLTVLILTGLVEGWGK